MKTPKGRPSAFKKKKEEMSISGERSHVYRGRKLGKFHDLVPLWVLRVR